MLVYRIASLLVSSKKMEPVQKAKQKMKKTEKKEIKKGYIIICITMIFLRL